MSSTGLGDSPLSSSFITIPSLYKDVRGGSYGSNLQIIMDTYFFGTKVLKRWDATQNQMVASKLKRWDGSSWVAVKLNVWNGSSWIRTFTLT